MSERPTTDERVGNYQLLDLIGQGGMGAVYRAVHPEIGRTVAIKVLRQDLAASEEATSRFFDEARAVNAIRHEGIVDIFDLGRRADGSTYYVMEFLTGEDLGQLLRREGAMRADEAVAIVKQVCGALAAAHRRGIVHRDLKPQNLFVVTRGAERRLKLLDFGIAKLVHELSDRPTTSTGVVLGTIPYMSPEQARGEAVDARTDIYSLGCILFELLTGQVPFAASNPLAILARLAMEEPSPPSWRSHRFGVPRELDDVVLRALAKDRDKRYSDIEELDAAIGALDLSKLPPPSPRIEAKTSPGKKVIAAAVSEDAPTLPHPELSATVADGARAPSPPRSPAASPSRDPSPSPSRDPLVVDPLTVSTRQLHEKPLPLIDPSTERRVIRFVIPVLLGLVALGVGLYFAPGAVALDHVVLRRWLPPFGAAMLALCGLLLVIARTQQSSQGRVIVNRLLTILSVAIVTTSIHLKGSLTSYDILYYPVLVILDRLRENRSLAIFTLVTSVIGFSGAVLLAHFGVVDYGPLYPGRISPELVADTPLVTIVLLVMAGITFLSFLLVDLLARRVQLREAELRTVGLSLAGRVEEQVELLRRSADLRHYLPPALADAILRGDPTDSSKHQRRRVTVVRVDCPVIAGAVDETDPEEFAHLVNQLCARLGDAATQHDGIVERFGGGGVTVLFGALDAGAPEDHARDAVAFVRSATQAIAGLSLACQSAGIAAPPVARAVLHQGFATVGSFGSPSRLEFTAVGPVMEAAASLLDDTPPGTVIVTQLVEVALRQREPLSPRGEPVNLPGARHPVRLFTLG
jgi:serine/threonine protein kinase/class 3 adenylate cyclase